MEREEWAPFKAVLKKSLSEQVTEYHRSRSLQTSQGSTHWAPKQSLADPGASWRGKSGAEVPRAGRSRARAVERSRVFTKRPGVCAALDAMWFTPCNSRSGPLSSPHFTDRRKEVQRGE